VTCWTCHTARPPASVSTVTCADCHDALVGGADWTVTCYGCHGSRESAAPPKDILGNTSTTAIGVGAHQKHVRTGTMAVYDCTYCHEKPADVFAPTHLNGQVLVTGYTGTDPTALAAIGNPTWDRTAQTCATAYCHGNYSGTFTYFFQGGDGTLEEKTVTYAGTPAQPVWTSGAAPCGSCHAVPPPAAASGLWHGNHRGGTACDLCHPDVNAAGTAITNLARHADGVLDVAPRWSSPCFVCH
jgi:hypothetical protein